MFSHVFALPSLWFLILNSIVITCILIVCGNASEVERKMHIVYMGDRQGDVSLHKSMLSQATGSTDASELLIHSYQRSFSGFAAKLSDEEVIKLASTDGVVSVFPNRQRVLHTTKSWNFVGFPLNVARETTIESDIIIGMLDTGIWPESDSFNDEGLSSPPSKWKGACHSSNFTCNNKIIGARYYLFKNSSSSKEDQLLDASSARDSEGHGSHTSSTAAGRQVGGASLFGLAEGTARGGVPSARIAVYKICWSNGCSDAAILAAFDDAIADGVDIISISVGTSYPLLNYFEDSIAIGAFHAMKHGILTCNSGGNSGPDPGTIVNTSPWSLTVAANTIDRRFVAEVKLGTGDTYRGAAINTFDLNETMYPLVYGGNAPNGTSASSRYCYEGSLDEKLVKGKIVLCDDVSSGGGPLNAGAVGVIMQSEYVDKARSFPLPSSVLPFWDGGNISTYLNTTSNPMATILRSQEVGDPKAPYVVSFSSRGPNPIIQDILKPDLSAPGVDILAAWSPMKSMSSYDEGDKRSVSYNIISGTSMSCPHATGAAAYVKSYHPLWSPAAIKSALITTARAMSSPMNKDAEFAYGAGQIDPVAAVNPGLVYDAGEADYVSMLCGQGYTSKKLRLVTGDSSSSCSSTSNKGKGATATATATATARDLNYPSFALSVKKGQSFSASFNRTVTNVGLATSSYKTIVTSPSGLTVTVEPSTLSFQSLLEKQPFLVKVEGLILSEEVMLSASLVLYDGVHYVRSPVVVYTS